MKLPPKGSDARTVLDAALMAWPMFGPLRDATGMSAEEALEGIYELMQQKVLVLEYRVDQNGAPSFSMSGPGMELFNATIN